MHYWNSRQYEKKTLCVIEFSCHGTCFFLFVCLSIYKKKQSVISLTVYFVYTAWLHSHYFTFYCLISLWDVQKQ